MLILAVLAEIIFFPTLPNFFGCVMAVLSYWIFSYFLKATYIRLFPFAFLMYLSMFMYRFLPLIATIIEGKPISYGFERPYQTFLYEILLFLVSSFAFYLASSRKNRYQNNFIQKKLEVLGFFNTSPFILWTMGIIGLVIRLYNFSADDVDYGDVGGKFLAGLNYLMYAPLVLLFPSLLRLNYSNNKIVWLYIVVIFTINIASNSRQSIITPIAIIFILFFLFIVLKNYKITNYISPLNFFLIAISLILVLNLLSNISLAMLYTRNARSNISKIELFEKTINTLQDEVLMKQLKNADNVRDGQIKNYNEGWTEDYVDNFMLARYSNMRITDQTLYYAEIKGYANNQMQNNLYQKILALFPTPILRLFGINLDKSSYFFSRGDLLYGQGLSSFFSHKSSSRWVSHF